MADSAPLDARLLNLFDELQWLIFRLHGVHSRLTAPWLGDSGNHWGFHRPWFCFFIHDSAQKLPGAHPLRRLSDECGLAREVLSSKDNPVSFGKCGSGLRLMSLRISTSDNISMSVLLGPYATEAHNRTWLNNIINTCRISDKERFDWAFRRLPILDGEKERCIRLSVTSLIRNALDRFSPVIRGGKWEALMGDEVESVYPPLRTGDDLGTSIYGVFVEMINGPVYPSPRSLRAGFHQMYFVRKGEGTAIANSAKYSLVEGQATICRSNSRFQIAQSPGEKLQIITISFSGYMPMLNGYFGKPLVFNHHQQSLLREICSLCPPGYDRGHRSSQAKVLLVLLFTSIANSAGAHPKKNAESVLPTFESNRKRHLVQQACELIRLNIESPIPLKDISVHLGISVPTLYRYFAEEIVTSPASY